MKKIVFDFLKKNPQLLSCQPNNIPFGQSLHPEAASCNDSTFIVIQRRHRRGVKIDDRVP